MGALFTFFMLFGPLIPHSMAGGYLFAGGAA
jgi:hypothetical protein